jgi:hypothetical protein
MPINIYTPSVQTVLKLMESSTANHPCTAELEIETGLSKQTILGVMHTLRDAGIVHDIEDYPGESEFRGRRIRYEFTPDGLALVRLMPETT